MLNRITNLRETLGLLKDDINNVSSSSKRGKIAAITTAGQNSKAISPSKASEKVGSAQSKTDKDFKKLLQEADESPSRDLRNVMPPVEKSGPTPGYISIPEHEAIVCEEIRKVERYFKNLLAQSDAEHEARIRILQEKYEDSLRQPKLEPSSLIDVTYCFLIHENEKYLTSKK